MISDFFTAIYGADLPAEAYVFYRSWPQDNELLVDRFFHPWAILALGTPRANGLELDEHDTAIEAKEVASNADFIPLMSLQAGETEYDGHVIGCSASHLERGDSSIFSRPESEDASSVSRLGGSLHSWMTEHHRIEKAQYEAPENQRTASDWHLKHAAQWLKEIEKLQRKVSESSVPT